MRLLLISITFIALFFTACDEELEQQVVASYPNGKPMRVEFVKYIGDRKTVLKEARYFPNGNIETEGSLQAGKKNGLWLTYKNDGFKYLEENYKNDQLHGEFTMWYRSGSVNYQGEYFEGKPHGEWKFFKADGSATKRVVYDKGNQISSEDL